MTRTLIFKFFIIFSLLFASLVKANDITSMSNLKNMELTLLKQKVRTTLKKSTKVAIMVGQIILKILANSMKL